MASLIPQVNPDRYAEPKHSIRSFKLIEDCYIFIYHLGENNEGEFLLLPSIPDEVSDSLGSTFNETNALSRSAPIFSFSNSGPRSIKVQLHLHRDMMKQINYNNSNFKIEDIGDDYVDSLIKKLQSIALPNYNASSKSVVPPMIALRLGNEVFIKGVVNSGVSTSYTGPILSNRKYAEVTISFNVYEVDPYDANTVAQDGSFRGITRTNTLKLFKNQGV